MAETALDLSVEAWYQRALRDDNDGGVSEYVWPGRPEYGELYSFMLDAVPSLLEERERLEQAVLEMWWIRVFFSDETAAFICRRCHQSLDDDQMLTAPPRDFEHAEDCLVPVLIAKHETP